MPAAIYARYSSDQQRKTSIDDQVALCRKAAEAQGLEVGAVYHDEETSGSTRIADRHGGRDLLADAMAGFFQVLLLEGLDRLSRDQLEQELQVRRLEYRGIRLIGVSDGYDSRHGGRKVLRSVRGLINEIYLDDLRHKTHRGLSGQVARGLFAGGLPYGYRSIDADDGHALEIREDQAEWVRWIFRQYTEGRGCRAIAHELNNRGARSPRGGAWAVSAIYGNRSKSCGILNQDLYRGIYTWNRSQWTRDPETGKRRRIERPESEWQRIDLPHLRIVTDELWNAAKRTQRERAMTRPNGGRPAATLLGGLLHCGTCDGPIVAINGSQYGCARLRDRGPAACSGNVRFRRRVAEETLLGLVRDELLSSLNIEALRTAVREALKSRQKENRGDGLRSRRNTVERELARLAMAIAELGPVPALMTRIRDLEAERIEIDRQLATAPTLITDAIVPNLAARYRAALEDLPGTTARDITSARQALQAVLGKVSVERVGGATMAHAQHAYSGLLGVGVDNGGSGGRI